MARCGCASDRCNCNFIAGENVIISGTGTRSNPYVVQAIVPDSTGGTGGTEPVTAGRLVGEIIAYGGEAAPAGWLLCDGSLVARAAFPNLYGVIGTRYGAGDGMTTFALPDLNGRFPVGASSDRPLGTRGGSDSAQITLAHLPQHQHSMVHTHTINHDHGSTTNSGAHTHDWNYREDGGLGTQDWIAAAGGTGGTIRSKTSAASSGSAHSHPVPPYNGNSGQASASNTGQTGSASPDSLDLMPPYTAVTYIIKT